MLLNISGIQALLRQRVVRCSRIDPIRLVSTGHELRSVVLRPAVDVERLADSAGQLAVYELHGSLFFGSVSGGAETIRERLSRAATPIDVVAAADARLICSQLPTGAATVLARAQSRTRRWRRMR